MVDFGLSFGKRLFWRRIADKRGANCSAHYVTNLRPLRHARTPFNVKILTERRSDRIDKGLTVRAVETVTDAGPFPTCADITPAFKALEGLTLGPGWTRRVRERVGGIRGCTHIVELLGPLATTAFQTMYSRAGREQTDSKEKPKRRPLHIDSCHVLKSDGEVVKQAWPDYYTGS